MKIKHVIASLSLSLVTAFGVAVGFGAHKEAKAAKADGENTWMFRAQLNLGECSPNLPGSVFPADDAVDGVVFHYWGAGLDVRVNAEYNFFATFDAYGVNVALKDDQVIDGAQWIIHQQQAGDKYSQDITVFGQYEKTCLDKDTPYAVLEWQFKNVWDGAGHFSFYETKGYSADGLTVDSLYFTNKNFVKNPAKNVFVASEYEITGTDGVELTYINNDGITLSSRFTLLLDEESAPYVDPRQPNWFYITEAGEYDLVLSSGHLSVKKYEEEETYIYYVSQSDNDDSTLRIYTFGFDESHGDWEHRQYVNEQTIDGLAYVDCRNGLKFQGQNHKVYRIPVTVGYPNHDDKVIFSNDNGEQSQDLSLKAGAAYWQGTLAGEYNLTAGKVLDIFYDLQLTLKNCDPYGDLNLNNSVCAVSPEDAERIYLAYAALSDEEKSTYVDCSQIRTYTGSGANLGYRSATEVFVQLGKQAGLISSSSMYVEELKGANTNVMIIISVAVVASLGLCILLVFKKKRHI